MQNGPEKLDFVEVRKTPDSTTWYAAALRDVRGTKAIVGFEQGVWPDREVPCISVRPRPSSSESVQLTVGDSAEVLIRSSQSNPTGWGRCRIVTVRDGFYYVSLDAAKEPQIVQREALRPVSQEPTLEPASVFRDIIPVPADLHSWLDTTDAQGCLAQVRASAGLALAGVGSELRGIVVAGLENARDRHDAIILIGTEVSVQQALMLLRIHLMHQAEVEGFLKRKKHKQGLIDDLQKQLEMQTSEVIFNVDADLIGRMLGKGGEHVKRVERMHNVEVSVTDGPSKDAPRSVRVAGSDEASVQSAKEALVLLKRAYPVPEDQVGWILGKEGATIRDIQTKAGLAYARMVAANLELCGSSTAIEDAVLLLDHHKEYFHVFQEMRQQKAEIDKTEEALDAAAEAAGLRPSGSRYRQRSQDANRRAQSRGAEDSGGRAPSAGRSRRQDSPGRSRGVWRPAGYAEEEAGQAWAPRGRGRGGGRGRSQGSDSAEQEPVASNPRGRGRGKGAGRSGSGVVWRPRDDQ